MAANQKKVKIGEKEFTLQYPGARWYLQLQDRVKTRNNNIQQERYVDELLEHVVVDPKVTADDFRNVGHLETLINEIERFFRED